MKPRMMMIALAASTLSLAGCAGLGGGYDQPGYASNNQYRSHHRDRANDRSYDMSNRDRIYRDSSGNYYCKRRDGTRGTIIGAVAGGVLGNIIAPNGSKTLGTVIGAVGGGLAGRSIDKNSKVRCE